VSNKADAADALVGDAYGSEKKPKSGNREFIMGLVECESDVFDRVEALNNY